MNRPDKIERLIRKALQTLEKDWSNWYPNDKEATRALKDVVGTGGKRLGYEVFANKCRFDTNGEWLFDMTWLELRDKYVVRVPLVLESEWSSVHAEVWDDFEKLLVARADHRVFVYWAASRSTARDIAEELLEGVRIFGSSQPGDRYLLACWVEESERFETRLCVAS